MKYKNKQKSTFFLARLRQKFKTKVRYRLLHLVLLPIFITLFFLVIVTIYWTVRYTWNSALDDVSNKLALTNNSISVIQQIQFERLKGYSLSYQFRNKLSDGNPSDQQVNRWIAQEQNLANFDYINWVSIANVKDRDRYALLASKTAFFDVINRIELEQLNPNLVTKANILIHASREYLTQGLFSRTVYPILDHSGTLMGYLDGGILLNNSHSVVDGLRNLVYSNHGEPNPERGAVSIFLGDLRVSTNVLSRENGGRILGTRVSEEVREAVLGKGEDFIDKAYVFDDWYISAYQPIHAYDGSVIGILYTGYEMWPFFELHLTNLLEIGIVIVLILIISTSLVLREVKLLLEPMKKVFSTVCRVKSGADERIGDLGIDSESEIAVLAQQFDAMLDSIGERNREIKLASEQLEYKVISRTAKLNRKTAELEKHIQLLNETRDKLIYNEKMAALGNLTAGIAHEINNPIAVILGNVELLKLEAASLSHHFDDELNVIVEQIDRVRNITASLLQYSRTGNDLTAISEHNITEIVREAIKLVRAGNTNKNINVVTHFASTYTAECNKNQLLQVLVNLLINAIQSMDEKGFISIRTENWLEQNECRGVKISIQDKGCGISPEDLPYIFDPFFTTKHEGTGLGLAVSQSLVKHIGGEITVSSKLGVGTTFNLILREYATTQ